jgi:cell division protein FtsZ
LQLGDIGVSLMDAFRSADEVLLSGVQGITDLITTPGLINLDFADVKSVMSGAGSALMGIGSARGDGRAIQAAEKAINSPLLEASMDGAYGVLLAIAGGSDLGLFEINEAASLVQEAAHPEANIIFGTVIDDSLGDEVRVTVIAAGFDSGTPTHKKLDPRGAVASRGAVAPATSGQVATPAPQPTASQRTDPTPEARPTPRPSTPAPSRSQSQEQQPSPPTQRSAPSQGYGSGYPSNTSSAPSNSGYPAPSAPVGHSSTRPGMPPTGLPGHTPSTGGLPSRAVPVTDDPDDEVDVPPFMRR